MLLNDLLLQNLSSLKIFVVDILGPDIVRGIHKSVKMIHDISLMKLARRHRQIYPVWGIAVMVVLGNIVPLYSWQVAQKIRARFLRTKNSQRRKLDAKKVLQATAITMHGQQRVLAVVERVINNYSLNITMQNSEKVTSETRHQFPTIEALSQFLEEKTILRLADFKSI
jgi:hypothetical protein